MRGIFRLTFFLFLALSSLAQFDHVEEQGAALNLGSATSDANGLHREFTATVTNQFVVGGQCRETVHSVTNVQVNNGPLNSGTYFSLTVTQTNANGTLNVKFGSPAGPYYRILQTVGGSISTDLITGICAGSATSCTFRYYCSIYTSETPLEVLVETDCGATNQINFYGLSVTQYVETIQIIPATRSLTQSTAVIDPFRVENLGPANFVHYYHDLAPTVAEAGANSRLYIEAVNWSTSSSGTAYICVSYDRMVASTSSLSQVSPFSGNIDTAPITVTTVSEPSGCSITCAAGTITGTGSVILAVPACNNDNCGFKESIWIGVVPPSTSVGSTYTVRLRFRDVSVPDLITLNATPSVSDGALVVSCNGQNGDFGCDDYFEITYASVGSPAVSDRRVGPFLAVELFGVYNGIAKLEVADGFLAGSSLCNGCEPFSTCTVCEAPETRNNLCSHTDCWRVVQPCQWNSALSNDWVFTVSAVDQDDATIPIEYGVRASIGSWPLTTVTPTAWETGQPNFGKVLVDHYSHYQVTFTDAQIFDDSYFEVELYTNYDDDVVAFAWNFNMLADDGTCYGSSGKCSTNTNCAGGNVDIGSCRFAFINCPGSFSYNSYFNGQQDDGQVSGNKRDQLQAGTYYFAVWGVQPGSMSYNNAIEYTIYWNYHRALPIYDQVTYNNFVYFGDYSPQYRIVVPDDSNIYQTRIRIADTQQGGVTAYARCNALAGTCPCWSASAQCVTSEAASVYSCDLTIFSCECPEGIIYVSLLGTTSGSFTKPITYSLTPYFVRLGDFNEQTVIHPISASRAISPIIDTISDNLDILYNPSYLDNFIRQNDYARVYKVSQVNVGLTSEDAITFNIRYTPQELFGFNHYDADFSTILQMIIYGDYLLCDRIADCIVDANTAAPSGTTGADSHCTITLQPCYADPNTCITNQCTVGADDFSFRRDVDYHIVIANIGTQNSFYNPFAPPAYYREDLQFTLNVQVVDQSPYVLSNNVPFFGDVGRENYVHFSFDVSQAPADNRLVFTLYGDHDQQYPLTFFINYESKAGLTQDCYDHSYPCYVCTLYTQAASSASAGAGEVDHCYYEITPCELSSRTGTYYVSVYGLQQTDNDQALFTVQASYFPTIALLDAAGFGVPTPGNVRQRSSAFYSVTVPTLVSGNIVGRVLSIDVEAVIKGQIYVTITQINPDNQCDCAKDGHIVTASIAGSRDDINWKRYSCELTSGEVYYISIEADQATYCDPTGFVVHAKLQNIISIPITLSAVDSRIIGSYDSINATNGLVLDYNQFTALTFTTNAPAGAVLSILITEPSGQTTDVLPFDVYLSIGSVYTPAGTNDEPNVGPDPNRTGCPNLIDSCTFSSTASAQCRLFADACSVPQGSVNWFITFSGEQLPLNRQSKIISVSVRLLASEPIITTPAISTYGAVTTTGLLFADTVDRAFSSSYYTTSSALGINAGDRVTFAVSTAATTTLQVNYESETDFDGSCGATCSATGSSPSCTIYACEAISAGTWFIVVSTASTTGTFTITRTQVENSTLSITSPSPLPLNTDSTFSSLSANEWRYHSFTVSASTSSHYELIVTGGASSSNIVYVSSPLWLPYLALRPVTGNDVTLFDSGVTASTCGGFSSVLPQGTCCYDAETVTFAVVGSVSGYTLRVEVIEFAGNQVQSVSVPSNTTGTATLGRVNWYSFTQPANAHLWFDFSVSSGTADLYLNSGSRAGSLASNFENGGDFGYCWGNDGLVGSGNLCNNAVSAGGFCDGFIASCNPCLAANNGYTFFFAVVPNPNATFSLQIISQTDRSIALGQNNGLEFPVPAGTLDLLDVRSSTDPFSAYAHYFYNYARTFNSITNFIPVTDEPAVQDRFDYANLEIYIDNFRTSAGVATSTIPVRFYINRGNLAGATSSSGCYGGRDITTGGNILPCIENTGAAFSNTTAIQCSINVCDIGNCGSVIYLSSSRLSSSSLAESYTYDIEIIEDFNAITEWVDIVNLNVGTSSFPFSYFGDNQTDVVYIRFSVSALSNFADGISQYVLFSLTNVTGVAGTTASFRIYLSDFCTTLSSSQPVCPPIDSTGICQILTDPCATGGDTVDKNEVAFIRVSRDSSDNGAWSFIFNAQALTVTPIDTSITALSPRLTTTSRTSYAATKEIVDYTWHFYEFFVSPSDGYSSLNVDINELCCTASNSNLEVYYSWGQQSDFEVFDNARPNRWATTRCNVESTNTDDNSNDITDLCNFWGGAYRIGIFAPKGHQLFPNTILGEVYPALYSITVQVNTVSHGIIPLECPATQVVDASNFISRWELYVPAESRGTQLIFGASLDVESSGNDVILWVSKNSNPWNRQGANSICTWDTTIDGDYNCSPTTSGAGVSQCTFMVPPCEFDDGIWYLFLQRPGLTNIPGAIVSFGGRLSAKKYTPTIDLRTTDVVTATGAVFSPYYQYYRILVDPTDDLSLLTAQITNTGCVLCDFDMYLSVGPTGFASGTSSNTLEGPTCNSDVCSPGCPCSNAAATTDIVISWDTCANSDVTSYFIGVVANSAIRCEYDLKVWGRPRFYEVLPFNVETCSIASCLEYWEISDAAGNTDLTGTIVEFEITNTGISDITVYINVGSVGSACAVTISTCEPGRTCPFIVDCIVGRVFVGLSTGTQCLGCVGTEYSILTTSVSSPTFTTLTLGAGGVTTPARFTTGSQFVYADRNVAFSVGTFSFSGCGSGCLRVLDLNSEYFFPSPSGLVLRDVGTINALSTNAQTFTQDFTDNEYFHFTVTPPAGVDSFTIYMDNVAHCACDGADINDLFLTIRSSTNAPPFDGCYNCAGGQRLVSGSCPSSISPLSYSCISGQTYYFTISACGLTYACPVSFSAFVEFGVARTQLGGDHNSAFTAVTKTTINCGASSVSRFYVEVTDILSVSINEPHGILSGASVSVTRPGDDCESFACSVVKDTAGVDSSCRTSDCHVYSFTTPGTYYVDVNFSIPFGAGAVYLQVVNAWVDLSGSVTNSIIGQTRHFYRLSNAASAISIDLTISEGPSLTLIVFDDLVSPGSSLVAGFQETLQCSFGTCSIYIPSFSEHSLSDTFYIEIDSANIFGGPVTTPFGSAAPYNRATNVHTEKPTRYTLSATLGTANCAAPPSAGFCASDIEGGNVWSEINNSVWDYERPDLKDNEAFCRFSDLVQTCPNPSEECRKWLKVFSCLESFPQCDGSGFQMGVCQDVCFEVTNACGSFKTLREEFGCCSDRYVAGNDSTISTCYNIPPPPPPPETFEPEPGSDISSVPPAFVVPVFSTIDVFLPDDFVADKAAVRVENISSGSVIALSSIWMLLALFALFF